MPDLPLKGEKATVPRMISAEMVMAWSLLVQDAKGVSPLTPIEKDGAAAIAARCSKEAEDREGEIHCAAFYLAHGFRESGNKLHAEGDCKDHVWDSASPEYKRTHPPYYEPDKDGHCRPGDGDPVSHGPYQTRTRPRSWNDAVEAFARVLAHAEEVCAHDDGDPTCTPLEVVATGRTRTKDGKRIARIRYAEAERIERAILFADDPRQAAGWISGFSSFTMTTSLSTHEAPQEAHHRLAPMTSMSDSPDMSL